MSSKTVVENRYYLKLGSRDKSVSTDPNYNFTVNFNNSNPIFTVPPGDRLLIYPVSISLPYDWNNVNVHNCNFIINNLDTSTATLVNLEYGSPDIDTFCNTIETELNAAFGGSDIVVSFDAYTNRISFVSTSTYNCEIDFNTSNSAWSLFGGVDNTSYTFVISTTTALPFPNKPDLTYIQDIEVYASWSKRSLGMVNNILSNTLLMFNFSINDTVGNNVVWENGNQEFLQSLDSGISSVNFRFQDSYGDLVEFSGPVVMTFCLIRYKNVSQEFKEENVIGRLNNSRY